MAHPRRPLVPGERSGVAVRPSRRNRFPCKAETRTYPREPWNIVEEEQNYVLASWQQIFAVVWRHDTTREGAQALHRQCGEFATKHARGIGLLTIVSERAPMPPNAARQAVADFLAQGSTYIKCSVVLMEGTGFRAAAVRSVVTGLTLLAKQAYPHRVCGLPDAVVLLSNTLPVATGRAVDPAALRVAIDDLRQRALP